MLLLGMSVPGARIIRISTPLPASSNLQPVTRSQAPRMLRDQAAIETSEVALIIAVVILVDHGDYQLLGARIAQVVADVAGRL